jgi:hypothetical protein
MPSEILQYIGSRLKWNDLLSLRSTAKSIHTTLDYSFVSNVGNHARIEPRYESLMAYVRFLRSRSATVLSLVKRVTIVAQALGAHEYGYQWGWEQLALSLGVNPRFSLEDQEVMHEIGMMHTYHYWTDQNFIINGRYRKLLTLILKSLPHLSEIVVGKVKPGEQIRGWGGDEQMKRISFSGHKGFDATFIFYSDWLYDEKHKVINTWRDETGCWTQPKDAGPQATFIVDFDAAMKAAGHDPRIVRMHGYCCCDRLPGWYDNMNAHTCHCRFTDPVERFQLTLADKDCSFCHETYGIDEDPFYDLESHVFSYETGYLPNRVY